MSAAKKRDWNEIANIIALVVVLVLVAWLGILEYRDSKACESKGGIFYRPPLHFFPVCKELK